MGTSRRKPRVSTVDSVVDKPLSFTYTTVHNATSDSAILINEDKLRLKLSNHMSQMAAKNAWHTPLGILLTLITASIATDFKSRGFSAETWAAIFAILITMSGIWLLRAAWRAFRAPDVEDLLLELMGSTGPRDE